MHVSVTMPVICCVELCSLVSPSITTMLLWSRRLRMKNEGLMGGCACSLAVSKGEGTGEFEIGQCSSSIGCLGHMHSAM